MCTRDTHRCGVVCVEVPHGKSLGVDHRRCLQANTPFGSFFPYWWLSYNKLFSLISQYTNPRVTGKVIAQNVDPKQAEQHGIPGWFLLLMTRHTQRGQPDRQHAFTGSAVSLSPTGVQNAKNQEIPVVCRERAHTAAYVGGSKPLNHLQMIDLWLVSHQTLCVHGFHGRCNPTWCQASTRIVDYYYVWKLWDDNGRSLTYSGQFHI